MLLLLEELRGGAIARGGLGVVGCAGGCYGGLLFLEGLSLEGLEIGEVGCEGFRELLLFEFLVGL